MKFKEIRKVAPWNYLWNIVYKDTWYFVDTKENTATEERHLGECNQKYEKKADFFDDLEITFIDRKYEDVYYYIDCYPDWWKEKD